MSLKFLHNTGIRNKGPFLSGIFKRVGRRIRVFLAIVLLSVCLIFAFMQVVLFKINQNREAIVNKLKQEFSFPIRFSFNI